jgi:predicted TPR repeat methyltransferase
MRASAEAGQETSREEPSEEPTEELAELTLDEALQVAIKLHRAGHLDEAEILYGRILAIVPEQPDALHYMGILAHQRGRGEEAVELIRRAIALDPGRAEACSNLGNVFLQQERAAEAIAAYQQAIALQPGFAGAYNNLGAVLRTQERFAEAAAAYEKAIELDPQHVDAYNNMGNLLSCQNRVKEAVVCYCKAITLTPGHPEANRMLGIAYYTLRQFDAAAQVFARWLEQEPDHPVAKHMYAACSGKDIPPRASDAYVETTFDGFADSFDAKLGKLSYRAPQLVADALALAAGAPARQFVALDAGCGTGLCGPLIAPWVSHLSGVDLSAGMLANAKTRAVYDQLVKAELTAYLQAHAAAFDLVISADTLCYFGQLDEVLRAACTSLRHGGLLIFTVEETPPGDSAHRLNPNGRYSHSQAYLQGALSAAGFSEPVLLPTSLRNEGGEPVAGLVVTVAKA